MSDPESCSELRQSMVLAALGSGDAVTVDQLMMRLPELTFSELFFALDALSRRGEVFMRRRGFEYEISVPKTVPSRESGAA
jgi:hypothetical protein